MEHRYTPRILLAFALAAPATAQTGLVEWLHWDAPRPDGSLYGGRLSIPLVPRTTHRIPAPVTALFGTYGPAGDLIERINAFIDAGAEHISLRFTHKDQMGQLDRFTKEVLPHLNLN